MPLEYKLYLLNQGTLVQMNGAHLLDGNEEAEQDRLPSLLPVHAGKWSVCVHL